MKNLASSSAMRDEHVQGMSGQQECQRGHTLPTPPHNAPKHTKNIVIGNMFCAGIGPKAEKPNHGGERRQERRTLNGTH